MIRIRTVLDDPELMQAMADITPAAEVTSEIHPAIEKYRAKDALFTPSNLISAMRAMMTVPAIMAIVAHLYLLVAAIFVAAYISDLLDGLLARKLDAVTEVGKIIDPLADKIFVGAVVITMAAYGLIPMWFLVAILLRDFLILLGGLWARRRLGVVLPSNYMGKVAVISIALPLFMIFLNVNASTVQNFERMSLGLMVASILSYGWRVVELVRTSRG